MTARLAVQAPPIPSGGWRGAIVERHQLGGETLWSTTVRHHFGKAKRAWFTDRAAALTYGLEIADQHSLPLIDLGTADAEDE